MKSFEELWIDCEQHQQTAQQNNSIQNIIDELVLKIQLYKSIDIKIEIPQEDRKIIKMRTMGEILLTIKSLSSKDDINVYEALSIALLSRN